MRQTFIYPSCKSTDFRDSVATTSEGIEHIVYPLLQKLTRESIWRPWGRGQPINMSLGKIGWKSYVGAGGGDNSTEDGLML